MQRVIVRQISGKRANQTDEFAVGSFSEILVGRDESASVAFDLVGDDLVSRRHMRIVPDPSRSGSFQAIDLQSRNGTFLNRQRLYAPASISHGDLVQLGPGGPEFRFELDPPPSSLGRPTREVGAAYSAGSSCAMPTREVSLNPASEPRSEARLDAPRPVGRATVERMLGESFSRVKGESKKVMWTSLSASLALLLVGAAFYVHLRGKAQEGEDLARQQHEILQQMDVQMQQQSVASSKQIGQLAQELQKSSANVSQTELQLARLVAQHGTDSKVAGKSGVATEASQPVSSQQQPAPIVRQSPEAKGSPYTQHMNDIMTAWNGGQHEQAMQSLQQLIAADPNRWEGFLMAGNFDSQLGMYPDALLAYAQAEELAPDAVKPKLQASIHKISSQMGSGPSQ